MRTIMNTMPKTAILSRTRRALLSVLAVALFPVGCDRQKGTVPVYASAVLPECTISAREADSNIRVKVTIANHSPSAYELLEWILPKNGELTGALFQVPRNGSVVEYKGRMVKRAVTDHSYIELPPGKSLSVEMALGQAYDVQGPGEYGITYKAYNQRDHSSVLDTLISNTVTLTKH